MAVMKKLLHYELCCCRPLMISQLMVTCRVTMLRVTLLVRYVGKIHVLKGWSTDEKFVTWAIDDFYHKLTVFISKKRRSMEKQSMLKLPSHCQVQRFKILYRVLKLFWVREDGRLIWRVFGRNTLFF